MRVLLSKIHCPFLCFCKTSSHIYTPAPFNLENALHTQAQTRTHCISDDNTLVAASANKEGKDKKPQKQKQKQRVTNEDYDANQPNPMLRSSLRKSSPQSDSDSEPIQTKKVQWLDSVGQELAEIREFETSEAGDTESEGIDSRGCVCSIL